jgi:glycosyltransferase involved in cell wall biosynthesis
MTMKIGILGTRGIPARYGGFETFAEELSKRLAQRGHWVTVYCRSHYAQSGVNDYQGVRLRKLPAIRSKYLETVSHTALSVLDTVFSSYDVLLVCNAANAFLCWLPRLRGHPVVLNVDGIERLRRKWSRLGQEFYRFNEWLATFLANVIVTDARSIQRYYRSRHSCDSYFIPYGAPVAKAEDDDLIRELGLEPCGYLLYVSRFEPENNALQVIKAYLHSGIKEPLALVGDAPYSKSYIAELQRLAVEGNVLMPGAIYGEGYRQLLSHCICYLHGTEVGGTHPALLEAMGAGALVIAHDTAENREVLGDAGFCCSFYDTGKLADLMIEAVTGKQEFDSIRSEAESRIRQHYDWEKVTDQYEDLFSGLTG